VVGRLRRCARLSRTAGDMSACPFELDIEMGLSRSFDRSMKFLPFLI
jgi:hypothetical protein